MDSSICIVLMVILILCFALLLAWLAARDEQAGCIRISMSQPEFCRHGADVKVESHDGCTVVTIRCKKPEPPCEDMFTHPVLADDEDLG